MSAVENCPIGYTCVANGNNQGPNADNQTAWPAFTRDLTLGSTGPDVKELQEWLNANGFSVAIVGPGSPGNETEMFGYATRNAVKAFQQFKGITPAVGYFGSLTRDAINAILGNTSSNNQAPIANNQMVQTASSTVYDFTRDLTVGSTGADVKALQGYLNSHGFKIAPSGPGSPGNETEKFGDLTRAALASLQAAHGISPAVGYFGPITRAFIQAHP